MRLRGQLRRQATDVREVPPRGSRRQGRSLGTFTRLAVARTCGDHGRLVCVVPAGRHIITPPEVLANPVKVLVFVHIVPTGVTAKKLVSRQETPPSAPLGFTNMVIGLQKGSRAQVQAFPCVHGPSCLGFTYVTAVLVKKFLDPLDTGDPGPAAQRRARRRCLQARDGSRPPWAIAAWSAANIGAREINV